MVIETPSPSRCTGLVGCSIPIITSSNMKIRRLAGPAIPSHTTRLLWMGRTPQARSQLPCETTSRRK